MDSTWSHVDRHGPDMDSTWSHSSTDMDSTWTRRGPTWTRRGAHDPVPLIHFGMSGVVTLDICVSSSKGRSSNSEHTVLCMGQSSRWCCSLQYHCRFATHPCLSTRGTQTGRVPSILAPHTASAAGATIGGPRGCAGGHVSTACRARCLVPLALVCLCEPTEGV